jgi:hypothetical protein
MSEMGCDMIWRGGVNMSRRSGDATIPAQYSSYEFWLLFLLFLSLFFCGGVH